MSVLPAAAQGSGSVKVTAARANIRAEASETSQVLTQVMQGTSLELIAVEGDWFHVRVPVGPTRVNAYISKKVAKLEAAPTTGAAGRGAAAAPSTPAPAPTSRDGMSVVMTIGSASTPLTPATARVVEISDKVDALAKLAPAMPAGNAVPAGAAGPSPVTFVWTTDGAASSTVVSEPHPSFVAIFKDVPGISPDDLLPVLVRLTPASPGVRLVAALRGRADEASRADADWDVVRDLKQDLIKCDTQVVDRGAVKITPVTALAPGEYAVVLRLASRKKLAGTALLGPDAEGRVFSMLWDFAVK
jgi:hypothetical protein